MAESAAQLSAIFDVWATKVVAHNDVKKEAYVLNREQQKVLAAAGIEPTHGGGQGVEAFRVVVMYDRFDSVVDSY